MFEDPLSVPRNGEKNHDLVGMLKTLGAECRSCAPLNPLECVTRCHLWKLRNELRQLRETMDSPTFIKDLLNVLKNSTRLHILGAIGKSRYSTSRLQEELKKSGFSHSRDTINQEYLQPLIQVGLAAEAQDEYYATNFGGRLCQLLDGFSEFADILPAHSECYEETVLDALLSGRKTFDDIEAYVSPKVASRILNRLKTVGLIETPEERDYVFFFQSKRDPDQESFSPTESKVYYNIPEEGLSARKLAAKTEISLRRTYKYLRGLKGKKLVFIRKTPKLYGLTGKGEKLASLLHDLQGLAEDVWQSSWHVVSTEKS